MRIPSYQHRENAREHVPMTPMIDIVFLLLIFFVCASVGQIRESLLATELSAGDVDSSENLEREQPLVGELWLRLRRVGANRTVVEFNNAQFGRRFEDFRDLQDQLQQLAAVAPDMPVILDIAPLVPMEDMIHVYDICRGAQFQTIQFATNPRRDSGP